MKIDPPILPLVTIIENVNNAALRQHGASAPFVVFVRPQSFQELTEAASLTVPGGLPTPTFFDVTLASGDVRFYPHPAVGRFPPDTILCHPMQDRTIGMRIVQRREYEEQIAPYPEMVEFEPGVSIEDFTVWCDERPGVGIEMHDRIPYATFDSGAARMEFLLRWNAPKP